MRAGTSEQVLHSWWVSVLLGVIGIVFGLLTLAKPFPVLLAMAWAFGVLAIADGLTSLLAMFGRNLAIPRPLLLLYALASIIFGLVAMTNPKLTAGVLFLMLSFWLIVNGVFRIVFAIRVRKQIVGEWLIALSGVLAIVLGIAFLRNPAIGLFTTAIWIGAGALAYGVLQVFAGFRIRKHKPLQA